MSSLKPTPAKIIQHSEGLGVPSTELVRQRARELARINGREEFNDDDWREAKRELHGGHEPNDTNGEMDMATAVSEHDMVACSMGRHVENVLDDQENMVEELVAEGMDEAVHEQMLAARSEEPQEDEAEEE